MPITHDWDNDEHTVYRMNLSGKDWTWADMSRLIRAVYQDLGEAGHRVNLILWFADSLPEGNVLAHMRVVGASQPANIRHTVFINNSGQFLETLITSFARANGWPGPGFVDSLEDARSYLAEMDRKDTATPLD